MSFSNHAREAFEKAGFKVVPCPQKTLTPEEKKQLNAINEAVNDYLWKIHRAYEASKHSTLQFTSSKEQNFFHFAVVKHGKRRFPALNTQKQR